MTGVLHGSSSQMTAPHRGSYAKAASQSAVIAPWLHRAGPPRIVASPETQKVTMSPLSRVIGSKERPYLDSRCKRWPELFHYTESIPRAMREHYNRGGHTKPCGASNAATYPGLDSGSCGRIFVRPSQLLGEQRQGCLLPSGSHTCAAL